MERVSDRCPSSLVLSAFILGLRVLKDRDSILIFSSPDPVLGASKSTNEMLRKIKDEQMSE